MFDCEGQALFIPKRECGCPEGGKITYFNVSDSEENPSSSMSYNDIKKAVKNDEAVIAVLDGSKYLQLSDMTNSYIRFTYVGANNVEIDPYYDVDGNWTYDTVYSFPQKIITITHDNNVTVNDTTVSYRIKNDSEEKQITFTVVPSTVCNAKVCETVVCSSVSVDASASGIVKDMKNHNARNIVLKVGDETYIPTSFRVEDESSNLYHISFGDFRITGNNNSIELE